MKFVLKEYPGLPWEIAQYEHPNCRRDRDYTMWELVDDAATTVTEGVKILAEHTFYLADKQAERLAALEVLRMDVRDIISKAFSQGYEAGKAATALPKAS
jgi:hypothetical protein